MSLIQRNPQPPKPRAHMPRVVAMIAFGLILFLLNFSFGAPTSTSLDASWTEVMAWAALDHAQWGRDIVFTYGPLGFAKPVSYYLSGIFWPFVIAQAVQTLAFVMASIFLLRRESAWVIVAFAFAYACAYSYVGEDATWTVTLLFGTTALLLRHSPGDTARDWSILTVYALCAGAITMIKFSLFPLWLLCVLTLTGDAWLSRSLRLALQTAGVFLISYLIVWVACGQSLTHLPAYFRSSFEITIGYGHTMGLATTPIIELIGAQCTAFFIALCLYVGWRHRHIPSVWLVTGLYAAAGFLGWRANFTRADHAPWFFSYFAVLPFGLLAYPPLAPRKAIRAGLTCLALVSALAVLYGSRITAAINQVGTAPSFSPMAVLNEQEKLLIDSARDRLHDFSHLAALRARREAEWAEARNGASLPAIRQHVGAKRVDFFGTDQGTALIDGFRYAPRPIFQSYSAYTPYLARLNENYALSPKAPQFAVLDLAPIDEHLPLSEDPLAHIALLRQYRPVLMEKNHLLLQRDPFAKSLEPLRAPTAWRPAQLGKDIRVDPAPNRVTVAFVRAHLSAIGQLYTFLLREPPLRIVVATDLGMYDYRFLRYSAAAGFVLSPVVRNTDDWARLQLGSTLAHVQSFRIQPEAPWQRMFFQPDFTVAFQHLDYLRDTTATASPTLIDSVFPGFNLLPASVRGISDLIVENGHNAVFLHAPGTLQFEPVPGDYRISGRFGIRAAALTTPVCSASADGIGMSLVQVHNGADTILLHLELDPFHVAGDRGEHGFSVPGAKVDAHDRIDYRIDPGHGGTNTSCDWSYVRDLKFESNPTAR